MNLDLLTCAKPIVLSCNVWRFGHLRLCAQANQAKVRLRYERLKECPGHEDSISRRAVSPPYHWTLTRLLTCYRQLAVVHGLVLARIQASRGGPQIYSQRCCPVSYGVVCRQRYDPQIHQGEDLVKDPYSKGHWAENQITWVVRQVRSAESCCITCRHRHFISTLSIQRYVGCRCHAEYSKTAFKLQRDST